MNVRVNQSVILMESEMQKICLAISEQLEGRERNVHASLSVIPNNNTGGRCRITLIILCNMI